MDEYIYDTPKDKKGIPGCAGSRLGVVSIVFVILILIVLSDFRGKRGEYLPNRQEHRGKIADKERNPSSQRLESDQGRDIVVTDKDLQKVYKDLLSEKKKEIEKITTFDAEKGFFYRIDLVSGRTMTAVTIQLDQKVAEITDSQGMIISIGSEEIAGITKVEGKAKVNDQKKK